MLGPGGGGGWLRSLCWGHFSTLHSRLLSDQTQLKDDVDMLRRENGQLLRERNLLQQSWEDMKRLREEDQKEIGDLRAQQQQVQPGWAAGADSGQASTHSRLFASPPAPSPLPPYYPAHPPTHPPAIYPSIYLPTHLSPAIYLCVCPLTHLLIHHPSIHLPTRPCDYLASTSGVCLL